MDVFVLTAIVVGFALFIWYRRKLRLKREEEERIRQEEERRRRREALIAKYGSEQVADDIMAHRIWQGMTSEQLTESWGQPEDLDTKVYKQSTKETWKYGQTGKNRFSDRVFTENGVVVGWKRQ